MDKLLLKLTHIFPINKFKMMVSSYPEIVFPLETISNKKEAQINFDWFLSIFDERINILTTVVNKELDAQWTPDFSITSLHTIDAWLLTHSNTRKVSSRERRKQIEKRKINGWSQLTMEWDEFLTRETALRCFDAAIYFGETLRRNSKLGLKWTFLTSPKSLVDLYLPVLMVPGNDMNLNPNRIIAVIASKNADYNSTVIKTERRCEVIAMYNVWSDIFTDSFDENKMY